MSLRIRRLKLSVSTTEGRVGAALHFPDGLVVLRADNTRGKSTCIKSIMYALGLERIYGPGNKPPLPPSMMSLVQIDGREVPVIESSVLLEIENGSGDSLTLRRLVVDDGGTDWRVVQVWRGPALSQPDTTFPSEHYYVRDPGAATRERGLHTLLASFIGWELPDVVRYNGASSPLYLELMFPLLYSEQMKGWSAIQATTPTFFQVRDARKRAIEFLLNLDVARVHAERQRISSELDAVASEWSQARRDCEVLLEPFGHRSVGIPVSPTAGWPPDVAVGVQAHRGGQWVDLRSVIERDRSQLREMEDSDIPTAAEAAPGAQEELAAAMNEVRSKSGTIRAMLDDLEADEAQLEAVGKRVAAIDEDLRKNQDLQKLHDYGVTDPFDVASGICPTCSQQIPDTLLQQVDKSPVMSVAENIAFLKSQRSTFVKMAINLQSVISARRDEMSAARAELADTQGQIRAIRATLVSDARAPSSAAIRERVVLQDRIDIAERVLAEFERRSDRFADLSARWVALKRQELALSDRLSLSDRGKIDALQACLREQEIEYGFNSMPVNEICISRDDYLPNRDGFDLVYDVSASDNIRTIAAFMNGLLEVARSHETNHPGLLILDEPRQQSLMLRNFSRIFERLSHAGQFNQQVIVATSEDAGVLQGILNELPATILDFRDNILQREME